MKQLLVKCLMITLLTVIFNQAEAQPNPVLNFGFEASSSVASWTTSGHVGTSSIATSNVRSGSRAYQCRTNTTSTSGFVENDANISVPNNAYLIIIGYYRVDGNNSSSRVQLGVSGNMGAAETPAANNTWYQISRAIQNTTGSTQNWKVRLNQYVTSGNNRNFMWDDVVAYVSSSPSIDLTAPTNPTNLQLNYTSSNVTLTWTNGNDGTGSGVERTVILRQQTNTCPLTAPTVSQHTVYTRSGGNGISVLGSWTVIDTVNSNSTTYTDNITASTNYVYAVVNADKAYNQSGAALAYMLVRPAITPTPANNATNIALSNSQTLSWVATCAATKYDVYFSTNQSLVDNQSSAARIASDITTTNFVINSPLLGSTTYFWRVVAKNEAGNEATGNTTWRFTTGVTPVNFTVTRSTDIAYNSVMSSGTSFAWGTSFNADDQMSDALNLGSIGFNGFQYLGSTITALEVNTNGFITFNLSSNATYTNNFTSQTQIIAPFWEDLVCQGYQNTLSQQAQQALLNQSIKYLVTGEQGNQVLTIEWSEMEIYNNPGPSINFQIKLYENGDRIEFVYGRMAGFNGTVNYTYSYSTGMTGTTVSNPITANQAFILQRANVLNFGHNNETNIAELPDCYSSYMFTPSLSAAYNQSARTITNDECTSAISIPVTLGLQNDFCKVYSSKTATASTGIPACSGATAGTADDDVWFRFTVTSAGNYGLTVNSSGSYNAVVQLFSGSCASLTQLACVNATGNGMIETIGSTNLEEGTYYVRVYDANSGSGGSGNFVISAYEIVPAPANDNCSTATNLTVGTPITVSSTVAATASTGAPACSASGTADDDVWFSFTASSTITRVTVDGGSAYNAVVQVMSGSCSNLTSLNCVSATGAAGVEIIDVATVVGTSYFVRVYHTANGATPSTGFTISVENITPNCPVLSAPAAGNVSISRTSANTLSWTASTIPSVGARTYTVQLSTDPSFSTLVNLPSSTGITGTSYSIAANTLLASTTYYWRVLCTNANGTSAACASSWFATTGTTPSCANLLTPSQNATNQSVTTDLTWNAGSGTPTSYDVYLSTNQAQVSSLNSAVRVSTSQTARAYTATALSHNTTYYWMVIPKNTSGNASGCAVGAFTTIPAAPVNDSCLGAVSITIGGSAVNGTTLNASQSQAGTVGSADDDVWYSFTASRTAHTIMVSPSASFNPVVELFSGNCGALTSVMVINEAGIGGVEALNATGLTPGVTYFVRVYDFTSSMVENPTFNIRIKDIDLAVTSFVSPSNNNCGNQTVTVNVRNNSSADINFTTDPITVSGSVLTPANTTQNFTPININTGSLAAGASMQVTITANYNVVNAGAYTYVATVTHADDNNPNNNTLNATLQNITLPAPFILTGSGSLCAGAPGLTFTLSGSETGVNYQLFRSGVSASNVLAGTGSALNFTNLTSGGTFRVVATNATTGCQSFMTASASITVNPLWLGINSNWNDPQNWCGNVVPAANANIVISGSAVFMPQLQGNITVNNLELTESNKSLDLNGRTLTVNGAISGSGVIRSNGASSIIINGSGNMGTLRLDQTTAGTSNRLNNITINVGTSAATDSVMLGNEVQVAGTLTLSNGKLVTNGNLVLVSNTTSTARVAAIPATADISGNVVSQRFVPAVTRRYRMISPNVSNFSYSDIKDDIFVTGSGGVTNGFDAASSNSASIFTYQESTVGGRGWKPVTNINQTLAGARGAIVFVRGDRTLPTPQWFTAPFVPQNAVTIDFVGTINKGNFSPALTYTNTGNMANDGWNLIGNPYPSQIDWNLVTKSNINSFVYTLDPTTNSYVANDGSNIIASGQAFFVKANAANPSVTFTESCKVANTPMELFKTQVAPLKIKMILDSINSDYAELRIRTNAKDSFDANEDALKFANSGINMGFIVQNRQVQINAIPMFTNAADTFVMFANASSGTYRFEASNFDEIPATKSVFLRDLFTNSITDLRVNSTYSFTISSTAGSSGNRFQLIIANNSALPVEFISVSARAEAKDVVVKWSTATEKNNRVFIVERSTDGKTFEPVGQVKGANNSNIQRNYEFVDATAAQNAINAGINQYFYRIRQIDFSGEFDFSNTVTVNFNEVSTKSTISIFPNPAKAWVVISNNNEEQLGLITIVDLNGKVVKELQADASEVSMNIEDLTTGLYFIRTQSGISEKLIVE